MTVHRETAVIRSFGKTLAGALFLPGTSGRVPALVVCHGAGEFKENYFELCNQLAVNGFAALAIDMRGHGESEGERFHVCIDDWIADVRSAVDFLCHRDDVDADKVGAFGMSSGGTAVLEAAIVDRRLKALIALNATVRNSFPWGMTFLLKVLVGLGRVKRLLTRSDLRLPILRFAGHVQFASDPEVNRRLHSDERLLAAFSSFPLPGAKDSFFVDTINRVSSISVPTLVLWGEDDDWDPPATAHLLYDALVCKKRLHIIPGNGHAGHLDRNKSVVFELTANWALENLR